MIRLLTGLSLGNVLTGLLGALLLGSVLTNCSTSRKLDSVKLELAETRESYAEVARLAEASNRAAERTHTAELASITQRTADENRALADSVARLSRSLQDRPPRPASGAVPTGAADAVACTGASLHREDGEFLVREAARADTYRLQLAECQAAYDSAVKLTGGN
jgi:hypothetical protein